MIEASNEYDVMKKNDILKRIEESYGSEEDIHNIYWLKYKLIKDQSYIEEILDNGYIETILKHLEEKWSYEEKDEHDKEGYEEKSEQRGEEDEDLLFAYSLLQFLLDVFIVLYYKQIERRRNQEERWI